MELKLELQDVVPARNREEGHGGIIASKVISKYVGRS